MNIVTLLKNKTNLVIVLSFKYCAVVYNNPSSSAQTSTGSRYQQAQTSTEVCKLTISHHEKGNTIHEIANILNRSHS